MKSKPLSKEFLFLRGFCCGNKCFNCPYEPKHEKHSKSISLEEMKKIKDLTGKKGEIFDERI
jgi:hypothetical protein